MITPLSEPEAKDAVLLGYSMVAAVHGIAAVVQGQAALSLDTSKPHMEFVVSADLQIDDLKVLGLTAKAPAVAVVYPNHVEQHFKLVDFGSATVRQTLGSLVRALYERVKKCDDATNPHSDPALDFLRHIRIAAFHGNTFTFYKKTDTSKAQWRGRTIDRTALEGKVLLFEFLTPGDVILLVNDVLRLVQSPRSPLLLNLS